MLLSVPGVSAAVLLLFPGGSVVVIPAANAVVLALSVFEVMLGLIVGSVAVGPVVVEPVAVGPVAVGPDAVCPTLDVPLGTCLNLCPTNNVIRDMKPSNDGSSKVPKISRIANNHSFLRRRVNCIMMPI